MVDKSQCVDTNSPIISKDMVPLCGNIDVNAIGISEIGVNSADNNNCLGVIKQTLTDICDKIDALDCCDNILTTVDGKQGDSKETKDAVLCNNNGVAVGKDKTCVIKKTNSIVAYDLSSDDSDDSDIEQSSNGLEVKNGHDDNQDIKNNKNIKNTLGSAKISDGNVEVTAQIKAKHEVKYGCRQNKEENRNQGSVVSKNQSPNEQNIPPQNQTQSSVTNECDTDASQTNINSHDLVQVFSVVEEDMRILGISSSSSECHKFPVNCQKIKETSTDESDSSEDSSSSSWGLSSDDSESDSESKGDELSITTSEPKKSYDGRTPKTRDELTLADLPEVALIDLRVDESVELSPLGEIESILREEALVIIKSFEHVPALDADSFLFLENRSGFGMVFEIFGQVRCPHYCVRFNNIEEIKSTDIEVGQTVYYAPNAEDLTNFVFVSKLNSIKGSDASWKHDQEPPKELLEYSDDEAESQAKTERKRAHQMKKRNEAHMQEQGINEASASTKKQKQINSPKKNRRSKVAHTDQQGGQMNPLNNQQPCLPTTTPHQQRGRFVPPSQQSQGVPPPNHLPLRIPPPPKFRMSLQSNPRGPLPRPDCGHQPFPPPLMGHIPPQPNLPHPPGFPSEPSNAPPPRNFIKPLGPPSRHHLQPHFEAPTQGGQSFGPQQSDSQFRPPFHDAPSMNHNHWSSGQPHTNVQEPPPQNFGMGPQRLPPRPPIPRGSTFPNGPPTNHQRTGHVPQQPNIRQEPSQDVQKYLDM